MEEIRKSTLTAKDSLLDQALPPQASNQSVEFCIVKRYSELLTFHNVMKNEMKNYMKKNGFAADQFPDFPPKKFFFSSSKKFLNYRVQQLNRYFEELFRRFP